MARHAVRIPGPPQVYGRTPRGRSYDGAVFAALIDPTSSKLHSFVSRQVDRGARVLDVGRGTGALAFRLAPAAAKAVGVELSPAMIEYANRSLAALHLANVSFTVGDAATVLSGRPDASFELATMVLVLHELPPETRGGVLREAARVARRVLCLDDSEVAADHSVE
jgi:ubiquinone/menaquinone biosynthesis C-methylase UbiE